MTRRDVDDALVRLGQDQHGVFSFEQAAARGATAGMLGRRVATGSIERVAKGIYVFSASPNTFLRRLKAAELSVPGAAVSGRSALHLYEIPGGHTHQIELTVERGDSRRTTLARVHQRRSVCTTRTKGFRAVTVEQAIFDAAATASFGELEAMIDHSLLEHLASVRRFSERLSVLGGARLAGIANMRALIVERGEGFVPPESELERVMGRALHCARVPGIVRQAAPPWAPGSRERLDALSMPWRAVFEADGRRWHSRMQAMDNDRRRDLLAAAYGFIVLRFTWAQLTTAFDEVVDLIVQAGRWRAAA